MERHSNVSRFCKASNKTSQKIDTLQVFVDVYVETRYVASPQLPSGDADCRCAQNQCVRPLKNLRFTTSLLANPQGRLSKMGPGLLGRRFKTTTPIGNWRVNVLGFEKNASPPRAKWTIGKVSFVEKRKQCDLRYPRTHTAVRTKHGLASTTRT